MMRTKGIMRLQENFPFMRRRLQGKWLTSPSTTLIHAKPARDQLRSTMDRINWPAGLPLRCQPVQMVSFGVWANGALHRPLRYQKLAATNLYRRTTQVNIHRHKGQDDVTATRASLVVTRGTKSATTRHNIVHRQKCHSCPRD